MRSLLRHKTRIAFVVLICVEILLVQLRVLDIAALATAEVLLLAAAAWNIARVWRRCHVGRAEGMDPWQALEDGLAVLLPRRVASLVALEPRIWLSLFRWLFRRRKPDPDAFGYSQGSSFGVLVIAVLFSVPVETLLFALLIPWQWLKVLFLILDIYALFWLLGFAAAISVLPHRLTPAGIQIYYGIATHGFVPYATIAEVRHERLNASGQRDGCHVDAERQTASISVGGVTTITLRLREPISLHRIFGSTPPVTILHLAVDGPACFVTALERRLAERRTSAASHEGVELAAL